MKQRYLSRICLGLFVLAIIGCAVFLFSFREDHELLPVRCTVIDACEWESGSGSGNVTLPNTVPASGFEPVTYRIVLPETVRDNEWLCILTHATMEVRVNGELRKEFDEDAAGIPGSIEKSTYHFCALTDTDSGTVVEITLKSPFSSNNFLRPLYLGDGYSIAATIMQQRISRFIGILVLSIIAMIGILIGAILSIQRRTTANIIFISVGILLVSIWLILDDILYPFFFLNTYADGISSYLVAVLTVFPFMEYVDRLQKRRYHRIYAGLEIFDILYFCAICIARFRFGVVLSSNLVHFNLPIVLMGLIWLCPIVKDIISGGVGDYRRMVYGLIALMVLSTLDIILINLHVNRTDGNLILLGLYILSVMALFQQAHDSLALFRTLDSQSRQISAISEQNRDLAIRARTDVLTGLYNREHLKTSVPERIAENAVGAMLMFDLDNFKQINDTYGHPEGDKVLIAFARALRKSFRREDIVCRVGGDEFVVFMTEAVTENLVQHKGLLILDYLRSDPKMAAYAEELDTSMGAAYVPKDGTDFETLYKLADERMYIEKNKHHAR